MSDIFEEPLLSRLKYFPIDMDFVVDNENSCSSLALVWIAVTMSSIDIWILLARRNFAMIFERWSGTILEVFLLISNSVITSPYFGFLATYAMFSMSILIFILKSLPGCKSMRLSLFGQNIEIWSTSSSSVSKLKLSFIRNTTSTNPLEGVVPML